MTTFTDRARQFETYCLGVGCMFEKCPKCQHERNWQTLNELPDVLRLKLQAQMTRIDQTGCQINSGLFFASYEDA